MNNIEGLYKSSIIKELDGMRIKLYEENHIAALESKTIQPIENKLLSHPVMGDTAVVAHSHVLSFHSHNFSLQAPLMGSFGSENMMGIFNHNLKKDFVIIWDSNSLIVRHALD
jgi:hypothetical protein